MAQSILEIILRGKDAGASAAVKGLDKALGGLRNILGGLGLGLGAAEMVQFGQASIAAARESAAAEAELQAVLVSSGQATAEYKDQLEGLATALENTSLFSDEAVTHAQAVLLTFDKIGQETMPRATQAAADLAQLLGTDLQSASIQIGKALQGQISALARSGVSFTEEEKARAEALFATGRAAEAQGIILGALEKQVGGQAAAARDAAGSTQDYAVSVGRLQEAMGGLLLTIGDAGATDAATGWIDRLAAGAGAWSSVIENIKLLSEANQQLAEESGKVEIAQRGAMGQVAGSEEAYANAESALSSLIGWFVEGSTAQEGFTEAIQEVTQSAQDSAPAIDAMTAASNRAALAGYQAMRGMMAQAQATRDVARATQEVNQGQLDLRAQKEAAPELGARITEQRQKVFEIKQKQEEDSARDSERIMRESNAAIADSVSELGNQISSAVSGAISGVNQDVIGKLLGIEGAEANAGEAVRRMAAVAAGGIQDQWAPALAAQLTGVQDQTAQAFVQAFQAGDSGALQAAAGQLALNPIVELFDANLIAQQVEQKLRAQQLTQQLNDKVNALLGEKGLPAVTAVTQQVGQAATDTGVATGQVTQGTTDMATSAEAAALKVQTAFAGALPVINLLITRLEYMIGIIVRIGVVSQAAAGSIAGLNPPGAPAPAGASANGVPNGAQWKMGGVDMIE